MQPTSAIDANSRNAPTANQSPATLSRDVLPCATLHRWATLIVSFSTDYRTNRGGCLRLDAAAVLRFNFWPPLKSNPHTGPLPEGDGVRGVPRAATTRRVRFRGGS